MMDLRSALIEDHIMFLPLRDARQLSDEVPEALRRRALRRWEHASSGGLYHPPCTLG